MSPPLNSKFTLNGKLMDESPATCDKASVRNDRHARAHKQTDMCSLSCMMQLKQSACEKRWMFFDTLLCCCRSSPSSQSASPKTQTQKHICNILKEALTISKSASGEEGYSSVSFSPLEPCDCGRTSLNDRLSRVPQQALHDSFSLREKTMWQLCPCCLLTSKVPCGVWFWLFPSSIWLIKKIYITFNKKQATLLAV